MTTFWPQWTKRLEKFVEALGSRNFTCYECGVGRIEVGLSAVERAQEENVVRKCPHCGEYLSFKFDKHREVFYDVKGK